MVDLHSDGSQLDHDVLIFAGGSLVKDATVFVLVCEVFVIEKVDVYIVGGDERSVDRIARFRSNSGLNPGLSKNVKIIFSIFDTSTAEPTRARDRKAEAFLGHTVSSPLTDFMCYSLADLNLKQTAPFAIFVLAGLKLAITWAIRT